jgi:hypothetical protein
LAAAPKEAAAYSILVILLTLPISNISKFTLSQGRCVIVSIAKLSPDLTIPKSKNLRRNTILMKYRNI